MKSKSVLLLLLTLLFSTDIYAQAVDIVRDFGNNMHLWTLTHDISHRDKLERLCYVRRMRISDEIVKDLFYFFTESYRPTSITLASYLNWFEEAMRDSIVVEFSEFALVNKNNIKCKTEFAKEKIKDVSREYVMCKVSTLGSHI